MLWRRLSVHLKIRNNMISEEYFASLSSRLGSGAYQDNICVLEGNVPVLVSVPHAVPHVRDGQKKSNEVNTDVLGFILHEQNGCHLFVNAGVDGDPNNDESNVYKDKLAEYVKSHDIAFVMDLHGASASREFDFELGTAHGRNIEGFAECVPSFVSLASMLGWNVTVDECFPANGANRVSSFVNAHMSVPSLQIEINRKRRNGYESVCAAAALLSRYIKGMVALLSLPVREGNRLLWIYKLDKYMPRNQVFLPKEFKGDFGRNDNVDLVFESGTEEFVIKSFSAPDGCVGLTGQMISRYGCEDGHLLFTPRPYAIHDVMKPQAEDIDNIYALLSEDLYEKYKGYDFLEVLNPFDNLRSYFKIRKYEGNVNGRTNSVWLSYYQRKLLGLEVPHTMDNNYMLRLLSRMSEADAAFFKTQFQYDEQNNVFVHLPMDSDGASRLRNIWATIFGSVRFRGVTADQVSRSQGFLVERLIGKKPLQLRASRCTENNEVMDAVFITRSASIVLGVSELDYVWITHEDKKIRSKVVLIEKEDYPRVVKANALKSEDELDMLVCIPSKLRLGLGIYEPGTSVELERSTKDLFIKNAFAQMMTLMGLFIAVVSVPDIRILYKVLAFIVLCPVIMYCVLSEERNKL